MDSIGVYVCVARSCKQRDVEVQHPWNEQWPLAKRQRKCAKCRKPMLFVAIKRTMSDEAKQKLRALAAERKIKP